MHRDFDSCYDYIIQEVYLLTKSLKARPTSLFQIIAHQPWQDKGKSIPN